jgi:hypothetical protein
MALLNWLEDSLLIEEVEKLLLIAKKAQTESTAHFNKNVIDPFAALFEMAGFEIGFETWKKNEITRQAQKTLQNHIGSFHQNILGHAQGWENLNTKQVVDLKSDSRMIIAEVKNKYNTVSGGKLSDLYASLDDLVSPKASKFKGYTAYYVAIIPGRPERYDRPFTPPNKGTGNKCPINEYIREIDGASFYALATGSDTALQDLFDVLPAVIRECAPSDIPIDTGILQEFFTAAYGA